MALALLKLPKGSVLKARANTAFGTCTSAISSDDGPLPETRAESGLINGDFERGAASQLACVSNVQWCHCRRDFYFSGLVVNVRRPSWPLAKHTFTFWTQNKIGTGWQVPGMVFFP